MKLTYEVWIRAGDQGGVIEPKDGKPLTTLGEAVSLAQDFLDKVDEAIIIEKKVVRRIQGNRPKPPEESNGDPSPRKGFRRV